MKFILREHTRWNAFQEMLNLFADSREDDQASERNEKGLNDVTLLDGDDEDEKLTVKCLLYQVEGSGFRISRNRVPGNKIEFREKDLVQEI